jgi:hypothetical protein
MRYIQYICLYKAMTEMTISVLGGCHVGGYPYEVKQAFPTLLAAQNEAQVVERIANLQFVKLPQHLLAIEMLRPSHVLFQLGNYEFCASTTTLLKQVRSVLGFKSTCKKSIESIASATPAAKTASLLSKLLATAKLAIRVGALGLLISVFWLCSPQHRRVFRALNACVRQHPNTEFLFLSPLPHLDLAVDTLRRLGGWLLRLGIAPATNLHWLDSHQLIQRDPALFYDLGHLNEKGHSYLAAKLSGVLSAI